MLNHKMTNLNMADFGQIQSELNTEINNLLLAKTSKTHSPDLKAKIAPNVSVTPSSFENKVSGSTGPSIFDRDTEVLRPEPDSKKETKPAPIYHFADPNDNDSHVNKKYFYWEKKINDILLQKTIIPGEYEALYLLTHLDTPEQEKEEDFITNDIWGIISEIHSFEAFNQVKENLQLSIIRRLSTLEKNAAFIYINEKGKLWPLLEQDVLKLPKGVKSLLKQISDKNGYFSIVDLYKIQEANAKKMAEIKSQYFGKVYYPGDDPRDNDPMKAGYYDSWSNQHYKKIYDDLKNTNEVSIFKISKLIVKMRFFSEFSDPKQTQAFEEELKKKLSSKKIELFGFKLLEDANNTLTRTEIQNKLNQLLLSTKDPIEINRLLQKGANVNTMDDRGTPLDFALWADQPNPLLIKQLLDAGADVNRQMPFIDRCLLRILF